MKVMEWVKSHPYMAGALVIGGGLTFIVFSGWFSGGSSGATMSVGGSTKSDSEIAADATIAAANIQAQAAGTQASYALEAAKLQAAFAGKQAELDYNLGLKSLEVGRDIALVQTQASVQQDYISAQTMLGLGAQQAQQSMAIIASTAKKKNLKAMPGIIGTVYTGMPSLQSITGATTSGGTTAPITSSSVGSGSGGAGVYSSMETKAF